MDMTGMAKLVELAMTEEGSKEEHDLLEEMFGVEKKEELQEARCFWCGKTGYGKTMGEALMNMAHECKKNPTNRKNEAFWTDIIAEQSRVSD